MQNKFSMRATSAIFGAMSGDSLGSTLEFGSSEDSKSLLVKHSNFRNGLVGMGPFNLLPGQVTDDSEMALALMSVVIKKGYYDQKLVAQAYHQWYLSNPPDIGNTTRVSVSQPSKEKMIITAAKYSSASLSNGFLMRLFGLVALYYNKSLTDLLGAICEDVILTHSHPEAQYIAIIYGAMLWKAINGKSAGEIYLWGKNNCNQSPLVTTIYHAVDNNLDQFKYDNTVYKFSDIDQKMTGFVAFAFWLMLLSIKHENSHKNAMLKIVGFGGDTDTNACIVGAVMGALYPDTIRASWIKSLVECSAIERYKKYPIADPKVWTKWLPK